MSEPNELPRTCEACTEVRKDVDGIQTRLETAEHSISRIREGFVKNDLGNPDYDGHRVSHATSIKKAEVVQGYQRDMTKRALEWLLVAVGVLIGQGALEWVKAHLK